MRLATISQPEAWFSFVGARIYHASHSKADIGEEIAVYAAAERPSWAEIERRAQVDKYLRRTLQYFGIVDADAFARFVCGAVIGTVRVVEVLDAREYDDPPLTAIAGKPYLWRLEVVRMIEPVTGIRARPNLWTMPPDLERRVREAPETWLEVHGRPPGVGHEVYPRGSRMWEVAGYWRMDGSEAALELDWAWKGRDPLYWRLSDPIAERELRTFISRYIQSHETRNDPPNREVQVDRRQPLLKRVFPDVTWVTLTEFERRLRYDARAWEQKHADDQEQEIDDLREALDAAEDEVKRLRHRLRWLTDPEYRERLEQEAEAEYREERREWLEETRHERDSWARLLAEDTERRKAAAEPDDDDEF
ncbi:MAG TPA: hypothetical protein VG916_01760 [Gemmatimonadaceae bacterium]|nr:hypothetical protein [Gemmatimonadaceae bacterium]